MTNEKYLEHFYESQFNAYDFIVLFSAINSIKNVYCFNKENLINFIADLKKGKQYEEILNDIQLRNNGVFYYSNDLDEAISKLHSIGILYTLSSKSNSLIYICDNLDISRMLKQKLEFVTNIVEFINDYNKYEIELNKKYCEQDKNSDPILCSKKLTTQK